MSKIYLIEPIVEEALLTKPETRGDNFLLYNEVLSHFIDTKMSLSDVFANHVILGIPSLESITRCRRKLQERNPELKANKEARKAEEADFVDYALADKQTY